jgi:hypothetical protein
VILERLAENTRNAEYSCVPVSKCNNYFTLSRKCRFYYLHTAVTIKFFILGTGHDPIFELAEEEEDVYFYKNNNLSYNISAVTVGVQEVMAVTSQGNNNMSTLKYREYLSLKEICAICCLYIYCCAESNVEQGTGLLWSPLTR